MSEPFHPYEALRCAVVEQGSDGADVVGPRC